MSPMMSSSLDRSKGTEIKVKSDFNFDLLFAGLHENLITKDAFTKKVMEAISSLAFLYGIDAIADEKYCDKCYYRR